MIEYRTDAMTWHRLPGVTTRADAIKVARAPGMDINALRQAGEVFWAWSAR